ncbi:HTH-like domain-containing protein [Vibrio alginolyticus]
MTLNELGSILEKMYQNAPENESVAMIHLFAIKYAEQIKI